MDNTVELTNQFGSTLDLTPIPVETYQNQVSGKRSHLEMEADDYTPELPASIMATLTQIFEGSFYWNESLFTTGTEDGIAAMNNTTLQVVSSSMPPNPEPTENLRSVGSIDLNLGLPYPDDKKFDPYGIEKPMPDDNDDDDGGVCGWILALPAPVRVVAVDKNGVDLDLKL